MDYETVFKLFSLTIAAQFFHPSYTYHDQGATSLAHALSFLLPAGLFWSQVELALYSTGAAVSGHETHLCSLLLIKPFCINSIKNIYNSSLK